MSVASPTLRLGERRIPVVLPSWRDPRFHTAAVILTVHAVGITALGFRVSVPQILSAVVAGALVDVLFALRTGRLVWPASGMLTGSGVALILRLVGMEPSSYWTWRGWHYYAVIAGVSVGTKYLIRWRGEHLFNPSNVGLVAAFLLLGSNVVEPLDFWWAPLGPGMVLAYAVIVVGGALITRRLHLLRMAVTFWVVLAAGLGILASSGHCMVAAWAPEPVCGADFWRVLIMSPEILVFSLFMITDPKTIPAGGRARTVFAVWLGLVATLLIAPHGAEYGAKVGLLGSLVILSPVRGLFDRLVPETVRRSSRRTFLQGVAIGSGMAAFSLLVVAAGLPAREGPAASTPDVGLPVEIDPTSLPTVSVEARVGGLSLDEPPGELARVLAENLLLEAQAIREGNGSLLALASTGDRLVEMQQRVDDAITTGERMTSRYIFDSLVLGVAGNGAGQASAALSFYATGTEEVVVYDMAGEEVSREPHRFKGTFVLRQAGSDRWLIAEAKRDLNG